MTGRIVYQPAPGTNKPRRHKCSPGVVDVDVRDDVNYPPAGSVWECYCGRTWIAVFGRMSSMPDGTIGAPIWRREHSWERRRRKSREEGQKALRLHSFGGRGGYLGGTTPAPDLKPPTAGVRGCRHG